MRYSLPKLPYDYSDLEPYIDKETMHTHHKGHHQAYVNKLNHHLELAGVDEQNLLSLVRSCQRLRNVKKNDKTAIINNCGGHFNHSLFWKMMGPCSTTEDISSELMDLIIKHFNSFDEFKQRFTEKAATLFGSGWVWLMYEPDTSSLVVVKNINQNNKIMRDNNNIPLLGLDVWEHAYYLKFQNDRAGYIDNWWKVVNWKFVSQMYKTFVLDGKPFSVRPDGEVNFD